MARKIYLSDEDISEIIDKMKSTYAGKRVTTDSLSMSCDLKKPGKVKVTFSEKAWIKMQLLVHRYSIEVEWHGLVRRESENSFLVYDILIFPHEITATSCISEQKEYQDWLDGLSPEERKDLRFHGHSHVKMAVNPSGTDTKYRADILSVLGNPVPAIDKFYLFAIFNKDGDISGEVYDLTNNIAYSTPDIDFVYLKEAGGYAEFLDNALETVKEKKYSYTPLSTANLPYYDGGGTYGGYKAPTTTTTSEKNKGNKKSKKSKAADEDWYYGNGVDDYLTPGEREEYYERFWRR